MPKHSPSIFSSRWRFTMAYNLKWSIANNRNSGVTSSARQLWLRFVEVITPIFWEKSNYLLFTLSVEVVTNILFVLKTLPNPICDQPWVFVLVSHTYNLYSVSFTPSFHYCHCCPITGHCLQNLSLSFQSMITVTILLGDGCGSFFTNL